MSFFKINFVDVTFMVSDSVSLLLRRSFVSFLGLFGDLSAPHHKRDSRKHDFVWMVGWYTPLVSVWQCTAPLRLRIWE